MSTEAPLVKDLFRQIEILRTQVKFIRDNCKHPEVLYKYGSNTGNYDPHADCYWVEVTCTHCGQHYTLYDDDPRYKTFEHGRKATEVKE